MGGTPRVFLPEHVVNVAWSPDGARLAYHTNRDGDPLWVADRTGPNARQIFVHPRGAGGHTHFPTWSPDGRWIYFVGGIAAINEMDLWRIAPSGGAPERLTQLPPIQVRYGYDRTAATVSERAAFLPNGRTLVYMQGVLPQQDFWLLDLVTRKGRPLTHFRNGAAMRTFDITPDGKQIVSTGLERIRISS
jgi:dipeptidyl aminopeptidase/acylaminoacyl peptidase